MRMGALDPKTGQVSKKACLKGAEDKLIDAIEDAVKQVLKEGYRTVDIMDNGKTLVGTKQMGDLVTAHIK